MSLKFNGLKNALFGSADAREPSPVADVITGGDLLPRFPAVVAADISGSMAGKPIADLNQALALFRQYIMQDNVVAEYCDLALVTFSSTVQVAQEFAPAKCFEAPPLSAGGTTAMGAACIKSLDLIQAQQRRYRLRENDSHKPVLFVVTDGGPTDTPEILDQARQRIAACESCEVEQERIATFFIDVGGTNESILKTFTRRPIVKLVDLDYGRLFRWFYASLRQVSVSQMGQARLADPRDFGL